MRAHVSRFQHLPNPLLLAVLLLAAALLGSSLAGTAWGQSGEPVVSESPTGGQVPGNVLGNQADSEMWRAVRQGVQGRVTIPDPRAAQLIQSEGDNWRAWRNGPITVYGAWAMLGIVAIVALFFAVRGRIKIDAGPSGTTIERFNLVERVAHWITATSFIVLAVTGLNLLYGRHVLLPILGPEIFTAITIAGKYAHNFLSFAFMVGVVMMLVLWIKDNIPNRLDLIWLAKGGGLFVKGVHPPAAKFNAGQKLIFWSVILGGISISLSGLAMLFPFEFAFFGKTFAALNLIGFNLPTELSMLQETQLSVLWHTIVALVLIAIIVGHIYIGSVGMEGAFDAMGTGQVDTNWAREHHSVWAAKVSGGGTSQAAE
ncbi:formate dehydrogenase subunit gamma [Pelagibius litoralis]|uniref:Formate dehydrogenase subunit gamma n=1 Tax=Pelagibius litoralis TaxID=374515 RepID=A0A967KC68_9PROT|nr:formate dehydrogenase subunit gamma [Pelagibius litoralis]NIA69510.1 formate dehydrogenase subunit gamma [Pelagibius litoralis]